MTLATGMIVVFALAANVVVDALGEALDPRSQIAKRERQ
jgi:ABC-type dipeptide/oligopeptide/nickel transport system permease subunit